VAEQSPDINGPKLHRTLGVMDLVFLNVAAIIGVRWLSTAAQMGPSSLVLWILAVLIFFIPSGLTVMELSSRDPGEGGVYLWSKKAFGEMHGFIVGWAYWINNVFYYPTLLLFISGSVLYLGGDSWLGLVDNPYYNAAFSLTMVWALVAINIIGLERGKWVQNVGAIATVLMFIILIVTGIWAWANHGSQTEFTAQSLMPDVKAFSTLTFFATMTFAFAGFELASAMGDEIKEPKRSIPRAMLLSGIVCVTVYMTGTAMLMVGVPAGQIEVVTGLPQALAAIGDAISLPGVAFAALLLVALSSTGGLNAWFTGVARVPYVIGIDHYLPKSLGKTHPEWGTPYVALIAQGMMVTVLMLAAVAGSTVEEAYIMLLDMCIILYFVPFLYMFIALPVLRIKARGNNDGVSLVPLGGLGPWLFGGLGFAATMLSVVLALIPPAGSENPGLFLLKVGGGCALFIVIGLVFYFRNR
jgi:amino acid transporter